MDDVNTAPVASRYASHMNPSGGMLSLHSGAILVTIGIIIFFVGLIIGQFLTFATDYDTAKILYAFGRILALVGILMVVVPLYITGITNNSLEWKIRATMISSGTALLIITMIMGISMTSISSYMYM